MTTTQSQLGRASFPAWFAGLNDEDLAFARRFLLASGSLKQVAKEYGISYPTVRLRLDRLIQKIQILESVQEMDPFERLARSLMADGKIDETTLRALLGAHAATMEDES